MADVLIKIGTEDYTVQQLQRERLRGLAMRRFPTAMKAKTWAFAVVGCDLRDHPKYLGLAETYEDAVKLQENMMVIGWRRVAVFDAVFQEVKQEPAGDS